LRTPKLSSMTILVVVALVVVFGVPLAIVAGLFIWAAIRDGEYDRMLQDRLGIRRRTRLGR
jgi:hypothetical protein